ncbi:MAG: endonuclease [Ferruginibacter sp.]
MSKKILTLLTGLLLAIITFAQVPSGYYNAASSKTGEILRAALRDITTTGSVKLPYTSSSFDIWDAYAVTDTRPGNSTIIWDMYSDIPSGNPLYTFTLYNQQCGTSGAEGDCYSREHQVPNSWWGGLDDAQNPQYTDLHHLPPADQYVNGRKSAHPIGQVTFPTWTSTNGCKVGPCSWPGYTGNVFEPINEYKGDFARAYLYIATRYMNTFSSWVVNHPGTEAQYVINTTGNNYKQWFLDMLIQWCNNDPVSQKEMDRNDAIYYNTPQHNRNPYIDHPEYVCLVWSSSSCTNAPLIASITQNPLSPGSLNTVSVTATVTATASLSNVYLEWGTDGISFPDTIVMNLVTGSDYTTASNIPAMPTGTTIYYRITAQDNLTNSTTSTVHNYTVLKGEPTSYPINFTCGIITGSSITLNWTDATGVTIPDGYLVKASTVSFAAIADPADSTTEINGSFTRNISSGIQQVVFSGLSSSIPYYFKIYPYTNSGTNINYKISPAPPSTGCSTSVSMGGVCASDLIISEYVEGSSSNKYIELYNGTGATVNLSDYRLRLFANGSATATNDNILSGTLNNQATIVYKNSAAAVYMGTTTSNTSINFNGDDAVALYKISTASYVDIFGRIGEQPATAWISGSFTTIDKTLVRNANVTSGVSINPSAGFPTLSTQWTQYNIDVVSNLGFHTMTCASCASPSLSASNISFSSIGQTSLTVNWTNGGGSKRIVVVRDGSAVTGIPANGTGYSPNTVFGSGDILNAGEYTVYDNSGSNVSITNLIGGHTYFVTIFEYNCVPGSQIYLTPGTSGSKVTYSITTGTVPESQYCITPTTGFTTTVDLTSTGIFSSNTYSVQLSDVNGSFVSPLVIGTLISNLNRETINCTIPANTTSGTGYMVRVVSSGPAITGTNSNPFEIILSPTAMAPSSVSSDRSGFCSTDPGNINLSATGGSGTILSWYSGTCGGTFIGTGNPLVVASPISTTTYYARWGNTCSTSPCTSVTVIVSGLPSATAGPSINNCSGPASISMTGASSSGGTNAWSGGSGLGTWTQNNNPALAIFTPSIPAGSFTAILTVFSTSGCTNISASYTRTISWGITGYWTGASSSDWFTSTNWCGGVPNSSSNIIIPAASQVLFSPVITNSFAICQNITLAGLLDFGNGFNLDVNGNWTNNGGGLTNSSGTVTFRGTNKSISGIAITAFPDIKFSPGSSYTMNNNNSCSSLSFLPGSAQTSLIMAGTSLAVNGNVIVNQPSNPGTTSWNINNGSATITGNVTIGTGSNSSGKIAKIAVTSGSLTVAGNMLFNAGSASSAIVDLSGGTATLNLAGSITRNSAGTILPGSQSTVNYNGSLAGQTVVLGNGISYNNIVFNNTHLSAVILSAAVTTANVTGNMTVQTGYFANGGFSITGNVSKQFSVANGATFRVSGNTSMPTGFGTTVLGILSTVEFNGPLSQTIDALNYGNLTSSGTGTRILSASGTIGIAGIFTPGINNYTVTGSTVNFNGGNQSIPVFNGQAGYNNLSVSQSAGSALAAGDITIGGTLNLVFGNLNIGSFVLSLTGTSPISGSPFSASKMIIADGGGELRKSVSVNGIYLFPVGDNLGTPEYSPVTINYTSGAYAAGAYSSVKVFNTKHPLNANNIDFLNRYWTVINSGITSPVYNLDATYVMADITGTDQKISMARYTTALPWIKYSAANTVSKTLSATGVTSIGTSSFSGISTSGPVINIQGGGIAICSGDMAQLSATITGSAPFSYSWSPGSSLSQATIPNPVAFPASTTTYTLNVTDANGIIASQNTTITVNPRPSPVISPNGSISFCQGGSVMLTSSTASSYLWSTGATTQSIIVNVSGNYTVTVTNNSCSSTSQPTAVTVNNCNISLDLKLFLQGYYIGAGIMQPVLNNEGILSAPTSETDTLIVELHHPSTFALIDSKKSVLQTNGLVSATFTQPAALYYISVIHRNVIQTWTANPVSCSLSTPLYDFTTAANKAYADNQVEVEPGVWAFYTGDLNQDGFIDANDFPLYDADSFLGVSGLYNGTDFNGDGFVDGNDFPVYDNNSFNGVSSIHP